jgi:hypothetical protein
VVRFGPALPHFFAMKSTAKCRSGNDEYRIMANYSMENYQLRFNMEDTSFTLDVVDAQDEWVASYNLMNTANSVTLAVEDGEYVIGTGETIVNDDEPHKHQVGGSNSQTFSSATLTGIGIMDLRDMGRSGNLTATYNLSNCGPIRLDGKSSSYPLWIKVTYPNNVDVQPPL